MMNKYYPTIETPLKEYNEIMKAMGYKITRKKDGEIIYEKKEDKDAG